MWQDRCKKFFIFKDGYALSLGLLKKHTQIETTIECPMSKEDDSAKGKIC